MLFVFFLASLPSTNSLCAQCASVSLLNQWQLTGFSRYPENLPFTPKCSSITDDETLAPAMNVSKCSSVCFEMVIPFENQYNFVRGCHADFIESGVASQQVLTDQKCIYSKVDDQLVVVGDDYAKTVRPVAAINFVNIGGNEIVNIRITMKSLSQIVPTFIDKVKCEETKPINCVKSVYYDGTGRDDKKESCSGGFCMSTKGKLNGKKYVERGCSPISPYSQSTCLWLNTNSSFASGPSNGGSPSRTKRSLSFVLKATQCFCATAYCNSSTKTSLGAVLLIVAFVIIRFSK